MHYLVSVNTVPCSAFKRLEGSVVKINGFIQTILVFYQVRFYLYNLKIMGFNSP